MYEWEDRKNITEHIKKQEERRKKERDNLIKVQKKEQSHQAFKGWLKQSLIKEKKESEIKRIENYHKKIQEDEDRKEKESRKVVSKIAYREWKERKTEEARYKKKLDKMEKKRQRMEEQEIRMARRQMVMEMQSRQGAGGQILLAYGLNKNLKQLEKLNQ